MAPAQPVNDPRTELQRLKAQIRELQEARTRLEAQLTEPSRAGVEATAPITTREELQATLRRFMRQVGLIVQVEKAVILLHDTDTGELVAQWPALGIVEEGIKTLKLRTTEGISGLAFREIRPVVSEDAIHDARAAGEPVALLGVRNALSVPLVVEARNEQGDVIQKHVIGVLNAFNKRYGGTFNQEDITLLTALSRSAASVISSARMYIAVVDEKRELESTLQSMLSGVLVVDSEGRVRLINSAARSMFGAAQADGPARLLQDVIHDEEVLGLVRESLASRQEQTRELSVPAPIDRIFQAQTALLRDESSQVNGVVATFNDITEIRSLERMKTEFVSSVSHELRTPLTSIKGFIRTLLDDTEGFFDRDTQREFYEIIDSECDRLTRLISDLLNLSRIESGRAVQLVRAPVHLPALIKKVLNAQQTSTDVHQLRMDCAGDFPTIIADQDKVDQILTNLVGNAIKYSPGGGEILVSAQDGGDFVTVRVKDEGIGIPEDEMDKVFDRFHRVSTREHQQASGTGIGLYLVKHLVEAHGGSVGVESEVGEGSTFCFILPKEPPELEEEA